MIWLPIAWSIFVVGLYVYVTKDLRDPYQGSIGMGIDRLLQILMFIICLLLGGVGWLLWFALA